jgi:hypothetical protein
MGGGEAEMKSHILKTNRSAGYCLSAAVLLILAGSSAQAGFLSKNLQICDQGSFFVGGVPKTTLYASTVTPSASQNQITVGQMYVQFQIPVSSRKWPLIMVHGSTHSGACLEATPQGTEGWYPYAVQNKLATYVVDQPGRGRSGNDESRIHEGAATLKGIAGANATIPNIGRITDNGAWTSWFGNLVQPGTSTSCTDILTCQLVPRLSLATPPAYPQFDLNATTAHIFPANLNYTGTGTWGPAPYGPAAAYNLHYYRQLVPNYEVTLPGQTCPACVPTAEAPSDTWSPRDLASLVERLGGAMVAVHSQSGSQGYNMVRVLKEDGQLNLLKGFIDIEGMCPSLALHGLQASDFDNVPLLVVRGAYRAVPDPSLPCFNEVQARRAAGLGSAPATYIDLRDPSYNGQFNGVTHMMMDGTNNLQVMDVILNWASDNIPNPPSTGQCNSPPPPFTTGAM